jgi:hypothetical protein
MTDEYPRLPAYRIELLTRLGSYTCPYTARRRTTRSVVCRPEGARELAAVKLNL